MVLRIKRFLVGIAVGQTVVLGLGWSLSLLAHIDLRVALLWEVAFLILFGLGLVLMSGSIADLGMMERSFYAGSYTREAMRGMRSERGSRIRAGFLLLTLAGITVTILLLS